MQLERADVFSHAFPLVMPLQSSKTIRNFTSAELNKLASTMLSAKQRMESVQNRHIFVVVSSHRFCQLSAKLLSLCMVKFSAHYPTWRRVTLALATVDVLMALATASRAFGESCTPTLVPMDQQPPVCFLEDARHPVMERALVAAGGSFIPNDIDLRRAPVSIVTGPNSGGKSTVLRTVAVASLLAQIGCRVPAKVKDASRVGGFPF